MQPYFNHPQVKMFDSFGGVVVHLYSPNNVIGGLFTSSVLIFIPNPLYEQHQTQTTSKTLMRGFISVKKIKCHIMYRLSAGSETAGENP